ncbi:MAG TPA: META domain-containing protein [Sphingomicrobium sp.]
MGAAGFRTAALALLCAGCTSIAADARTFEDTRWRVTAINRHVTPAAVNYAIGFKDGRIGGQFGCNHFGGEYRVAREILTTSAMMMTEMACPDPAMTFESWGTAVLQQPMRMTWSSSRRLTLSNDAGSIDLELLSP